jgi:hypothetical protein
MWTFVCVEQGPTVQAASHHQGMAFNAQQFQKNFQIQQAGSPAFPYGGAMFRNARSLSSASSANAPNSAALMNQGAMFHARGGMADMDKGTADMMMSSQSSLLGNGNFLNSNQAAASLANFQGMQAYPLTAANARNQLQASNADRYRLATMGSQRGYSYGRPISADPGLVNLVINGPMPNDDYTLAVTLQTRDRGNSFKSDERSGADSVPSQNGVAHQKTQHIKYQGYVNSSAPHHHARQVKLHCFHRESSRVTHFCFLQAAQVARSSAALAKQQVLPGANTASIISMEEDVSGSVGSNSAAPSVVSTPTKRSISIVDPMNPDRKVLPDASSGTSTLPKSSHPVSRHSSNASTSFHKQQSQILQLSSNSNASIGWSTLDLGGMAIRNISVGSNLFQTYRFLTVLYLNHNSLSYFPPSVEHLTNLQTLDLSGNKLRYLPSEMGSLWMLKELWVFDNMLETVPWELGFCRALEFLGIEGNPVMKMIDLSSNMGPGQSSVGADGLGGPSGKFSGSGGGGGQKYASPVAEILHREGASAVVTWLRDNMPCDKIVPGPVPYREWIPMGKSAAKDSGKESQGKTMHVGHRDGLFAHSVT